jgi:hypothetical protein
MPPTNDAEWLIWRNSDRTRFIVVQMVRGEPCAFDFERVAGTWQVTDHTPDPDDLEGFFRKLEPLVTAWCTFRDSLETRH